MRRAFRHLLSLTPPARWRPARAPTYYLRASVRVTPAGRTLLTSPGSLALWFPALHSRPSGFSFFFALLDFCSRFPWGARRFPTLFLFLPCFAVCCRPLSSFCSHSPALPHSPSACIPPLSSRLCTPRNALHFLRTFLRFAPLSRPALRSLGGGPFFLLGPRTFAPFVFLLPGPPTLRPAASLPLLWLGFLCATVRAAFRPLHRLTRPSGVHCLSLL